MIRRYQPRAVRIVRENTGGIELYGRVAAATPNGEVAAYTLIILPEFVEFIGIRTLITALINQLLQKRLYSQYAFGVLSV